MKKNLFISVLMIVLGVSFGCKNSFHKYSLVGKWVLFKQYDPKNECWKQLKRYNDIDQDFIIKFFLNGDYGVNNQIQYPSETYKLDTSTIPNRIIITHKKTGKENILIYRFQDEKLVLKFAVEEKYGVAKDFSIEPNFTIWELEKY